MSTATIEMSTTERPGKSQACNGIQRRTEDNKKWSLLIEQNWDYLLSCLKKIYEKAVYQESFSKKHFKVYICNDGVVKMAENVGNPPDSLLVGSIVSQYACRDCYRENALLDFIQKEGSPYKKRLYDRYISWCRKHKFDVNCIVSLENFNSGLAKKFVRHLDKKAYSYAREVLDKLYGGLNPWHSPDLGN